MNYACNLMTISVTDSRHIIYNEEKSVFLTIIIHIEIIFGISVFQYTE